MTNASNAAGPATEHGEHEDEPWTINIPGHPVRTDSPEYVRSRATLTQMAGHAQHCPAQPKCAMKRPRRCNARGDKNGDRRRRPTAPGELRRETEEARRQLTRRPARD